MITAYIFLVTLGIAFILLTLGLIYGNVLFGVASGILFILLGLNGLFYGIYEETGTNTIENLTYNHYETLTAENITFINGTDTKTLTENKNYSQNTDMPFSMILILLGIGVLLSGLYKGYKQNY
jgi:hypothetical protein